VNEVATPSDLSSEVPSESGGGQPGQGVATKGLLAGAWGRARPSAGALRVHILRLRRRIAPLGLVIHTLPGRGYLLAWAAS
jgi:DNA-binding response OmpR family regulator